MTQKLNTYPKNPITNNSGWSDLPSVSIDLINQIQTENKELPICIFIYDGSDRDGNAYFIDAKTGKILSFGYHTSKSRALTDRAKHYENYQVKEIYDPLYLQKVKNKVWIEQQIKYHGHIFYIIYRQGFHIVTNNTYGGKKGYKDLENLPIEIKYKFDTYEDAKKQLDKIISWRNNVPYIFYEFEQVLYKAELTL